MFYLSHYNKFIYNDVYCCHMDLDSAINVYKLITINSHSCQQCMLCHSKSKPSIVMENSFY